jgi:carboxylesterase type B
MQIPKALQSYAPDEEDEFECLNLNISMPITTTAPLPVFVWIYGTQLLKVPSDRTDIECRYQAVHRWCLSRQRPKDCAVSLLPTLALDGSSNLDPGPLVAQSIAQGRPCIVVTMNYRLNLLAYGDGLPGRTPNLQIQDLEAAVSWVHDNIASFSGSPSNITLGGESAGAILTHALLSTLPPHIVVSRALLCSGSLLAHPPSPPSSFLPILHKIETRIRTLAARQHHPSASTLTLATAPLPLLLTALATHGLPTVPFQPEPSLPNIPNPSLTTTLTRPNLQSIMLGDCSFEGILWLSSIRQLSSDTITDAFLGPSPGPITERLAAAYLSSPSLPALTSLGLTQPQTAALQFMSDRNFGWANWSLTQSLRSRSPVVVVTNSQSTKPKVYPYIFDEPNPFAQRLPPGQGVPLAHHAVDLLALWGGYDADMPAAATTGTVVSSFRDVGREFRSRVLAFVSTEASTEMPREGGHGGQDEPWEEGDVFAFGPEGRCGVVGRGEYEARRRVSEAYEVCESVGWGVREEVWERLVGAVGRVARGKL